MGALFDGMATSVIWLVLGGYGMGVGSALLPWMNAELLLLALLPLAGPTSDVIAVVTAVTCGQMTGKGAIFRVARRLKRARSSRLSASVDTWLSRMEQRPYVASVIVFGSATVGVPPFYLVSMAAGAAQMGFPRFMVVGTCGRFLHFGAVAWLPSLLQRFS